MNPVFSHFPIYIASIHSDIALGNKAGLLMQNVHSSMSYWQQKTTQMDRYAFTDGTVSLDTIRFLLLLSFFQQGLTIVQS